MNETVRQFEERKRDHIEQALRDENQARGRSGLEAVELIHEALPDFDFSEIQLSTSILGGIRATPFLVSSMTAGHSGSMDLNVTLARVCAEHSWLMGVGSQRRELFDVEAGREWKRVRAQAPKVQLLGNLGLAQLIQTPNSKVRELVDNVEAVGMIVHLNALQECMQAEGTPNFKGGLKRLAELCRDLPVPVIVKETGCGFSAATLQRLKETGVAAVDVSGFGGTHWGRIEGERQVATNVKAEAARTFADWGVSTYDSLLNAQKVSPNYEVWASGGIRSGLDAAKALALGAKCVGFAQPILLAATHGEETLRRKIETLEYELKTALFVTGCRTIADLQHKKVFTCR